MQNTLFQQQANSITQQVMHEISCDRDNVIQSVEEKIREATQ